MPPGVFSIVAELADDKRTVRLQFMVDGTITWTTIADAASLDALIQTLGTSRREVLDPVSFQIQEGKLYLAEFDPRWEIRPDPENRYAILWIRSPGVGWHAYGFPRHEAGAIARWLRRIPTITTAEEKMASLPSTATSFGGERTMITTTGLGFYYYGEGERRIGPNPFEQVEYDSDRAAGIVAGSIAEKRLEEALKSTMKKDKPTIAEELFRPSGPLGPFKTKIDLALMLGLLSEDAYKDLTNLKNIRNDFAHHLERDTFDVQSIKDRCKNFVLVDRHVGPVPDPDLVQPTLTPDLPHPYSGLSDFKEKLADARFRYMMTAQLISYRLGIGVDNINRVLPYF